MFKEPPALPVPSCGLDTHGREWDGQRRGLFVVSEVA